jgi:hypothetical protein
MRAAYRGEKAALTSEKRDLTYAKRFSSPMKRITIAPAREPEVDRKARQRVAKLRFKTLERDPAAHRRRRVNNGSGIRLNH